MTPEEAGKLKILDPACGSGSFLIGAYQYLLDWHLRWYVAHDVKQWVKAGRVREVNNRERAVHEPPLQGSAAGWALTTGEKKRILLNNIYGVDLDQQAVEVTKLSLLLKVLEGETAETTSGQMAMLHERVLPDLGNNIKWGNSLIGPDYYLGKQMSFLDDEETYKVRVFDWGSKTEGFGAIMAAGGFDAVIGNPPYGAELNQENIEYLTSKYQLQNYQLDTYLLFVEQSLSLLLGGGLTWSDCSQYMAVESSN